MGKLSREALEAIQMIEDEYGEEVLKEIYKEPKPRVNAARLNEYHLMLLPHLNFESDNRCEFGALTVDGKRPYGNSDVISDIREITGLTNSSNTLTKLHFSMHAVLAAICANLDKAPQELIGIDLKEYGLVDRNNNHLFSGKDDE